MTKKHTEQKIEKLNDYQHVRLKTEMYFGSRTLHTQQTITYDDGEPKLKEISWVPALYTAFREIVDNALDEVVGHGFGNRIDISYNEKEKIIAVEDNGRGIPIDWDEEHKCHKATLALSEARAGRNFRDRGEVAGTNGIGGAGVNFTSEWFHVTIHRDNKKFTQEFSEGHEFDDSLQISKPKLREISSGKTGTHVEYKLSKLVFPDMTLPEEFIKARVYEIALCNTHIKIYYNGEAVKVKPAIEKNLFDTTKPIVIDIKEDSFRSKWLLVPNFGCEGDYSHSIVNNIPAFNGGLHVDAFKSAFYGGLLTALEREGKKRKLVPNRSDINEGLLIFSIVNMKAPNFDSQSKTRLINEEPASIIRKNLKEDDTFKAIIRKNSEWVESIFERCAIRTQKKDASEIAKLSKKAARGKVPKLLDATGFDRQKCVILLAEGDSAAGGIAQARDPKIHGALPLRGKVMNVNGESPKKVLESEALLDMMNSIGLTLNERANRLTLRYGKVYLAHDADEDGKNIGALLVNFFYTYWPELFDPTKDPFFYVFMTPFVIAEKGKERRYWHFDNYNEFNPDDWKGYSITRAKGLGTLTKEDWKNSLASPKVVPLIDDGNLKDTLDLIFNGKRTDDRKVWISL